MIDAFELEGLESVSMHDDGEYWNDVDVELEGGTHFGSLSISQPLRNTGSSWDLGFSLPQGNIFDYNYGSENLQMARTGLYDAINNSAAVQDMIAVGESVEAFLPGTGIKEGIQDLRDGNLGMGLFNIATEIPGVKIFKFSKFVPSGITRNALNLSNNKGVDIALGLGDDLFKFADNKGLQTYRDFSKGLDQKKILSAIEDGNNKLHFNLTGFSKYQFSKFNPTGIINHGNVTNWELHTILNNPDALKRTTFYRFSDGTYNAVPNPFK